MDCGIARENCIFFGPEYVAANSERRLFIHKLPVVCTNNLSVVGKTRLPTPSTVLLHPFL